jgi:hypothetical protein
MIKEVKLASPLLIIGILLITAHYTALLPLNTAGAKVKHSGKNINFEIFDCLVQGNSTYEKSGRCPDSASEEFSDGSAVTEKVTPNAKSDKSQEPKAEGSPSTSIADTGTKPDKSQEPKAEGSPTTGIADTGTKLDKSQEPKAEDSQDNNPSYDTGQRPQTLSGEKYDFDEIHIAGSKSSGENIEKSQPDSELPSETLSPQDPFGPSVR